MISPLIQRILGQILTALIEEERLVLVEGADAEQVTEELTASLSKAPGIAQFGPWLARGLMSSPLVDDLYATDADLSTMLRNIEP
ncbi:MAG: hypothetical protein ACI8RZ_002199 [Myxococcota bacterium]|jgi:hypothetical protein